MITVLFSCEGCGLVDEEVKVTDRKEGQDVVWWMRRVCVRAVADRHYFLSPNCGSKTIKDLKLPIDTKDPDAWIGKQTNLVPPKGGQPTLS